MKKCDRDKDKFRLVSKCNQRTMLTMFTFMHRFKGAVKHSEQISCYYYFFFTEGIYGVVSPINIQVSSQLK